MAYIHNLCTGIITDDIGNQIEPTQDPTNSDCIAYREWVLQGNEATRYVDPQQYELMISAAVQELLDKTAQSHGYDGILSAVSYRDSPNSKFGPEGIAFFNWRDAVWAYCYSVLAACMAGQRLPPTIDELIAELPALSI
jgi:hypothetical protein